MRQLIKNIKTTLPGEDIGSLVVTWDMEILNEIPADRHPDNPSNAKEEIRSVDKIRSVEFQVYDKVGIDMTSDILNDRRLTLITEKNIMEAVAYESVEEIEQTA